MAEEDSFLEKQLFRKVELWLVGLVIILLLIGTVIFGGIVQRQVSGEHDFGSIGKIALFIAKIPQEAKNIFRLAMHGDQIDLATTRKIDGDSGFTYNYAADTQQDAGMLLLSRFSPTEQCSIVELIDLNQQKTLHTWRPDFAEINSQQTLESNITDLNRDNSPSRARIFHPFPTTDGGLIYQNMSPLVKINACSKVEWIVGGLFHHSIESDHQNGVWVLSFLEPQTLDDVSNQFKEDALVNISADGKILFQKSFPQILIENGMERLLFGLDFYSDDPIHLNDIQVAEKDSNYWKKGDLFLSARNISANFQYRPSSNRIIWVKFGPWTNQHDVDLIDDHRIAVFDNNRMNRLNNNYVAGVNDVMVYNFSTDVVTSPFKKSISDLDIRTISEGRSEILSDGGVYIEESNYGRSLRLDKNGNVVWQHLNKADDDTLYIVNWSRYLRPVLAKNFKRAVDNTNCQNEI